MPNDTIAQEEEEQIEGQEKLDHLNHRSLDERRASGGHPGGDGLDGSRQVLPLHPVGKRHETRVGFESVPPFTGFSLRLDEFRAFRGLLDEPLPHERRQPKHDQPDHHDGNRRGQIRALYFRLDPALKWGKHDR